MISEQDVKHIAKLARLGLTAKEIKKFQRELSLILDYFEKLKEVDVSKIEPTTHSILVKNIMRNDEPKSESIETRNKLIESAPDKKERFVKVKSILQ
ncbi:MAG: Asp-tRNA(Asn)/Glu-tRNA(Gln) amidotransferase GatCAB subunit C [Candidatus Nealsonbacteria bacterium CG23_combo_of_CG06-09_8_20_14_all_36_12]|uniref:Aspartyl/glutamyl-tRNA(Asn/Gln) amidotransferase subunit C n=1 Tax=Candidatus Nealsonbacteria bacterium CG23_combo_of_CG06-09_8_20_14_all_36_12 TaxID=1974718 RepID=A0A2G9YZY0_9BACT|nr:MAG: Asp-tRNA(Asn)/Glu-tRNA(Gln) amidotransferase GatCAB subunit C [Candidatus Nealsonbacteria bacterium CG23_combo_of_CG06-09_8_20_14_all_36_12]